MANKVKYGLKEVHFAKAYIDSNNVATYDAPVAWPGAVNLSLSAEGDTTKFRADNIDYWVGQSNNGYSGDFESALIPDSFRKTILGYIEGTGGILIEDAQAKTTPFALMFQFDGDEKNTRHVFYNVTCTRPTVAGQTTAETIEPQTETVTFTAVAIHNSALNKDIVKASAPETTSGAYTTWFTSVYTNITTN